MRQLDNLKPLNREYLIKLFKDKRAVNKIFLMNTDMIPTEARIIEVIINATNILNFKTLTPYNSSKYQS